MLLNGQLKIVYGVYRRTPEYAYTAETSPGTIQVIASVYRSVFLQRSQRLMFPFIPSKMDEEDATKTRQDTVHSNDSLQVIILFNLSATTVLSQNEHLDEGQLAEDEGDVNCQRQRL
ncbi:hypothetical protein WISP_106863 [Willisornis vidua]|uniref:Uncharacterized protein n=1 Tax=Willisornis vidua TaxID=1566151 RepID=A0ABQ9CX00_9PASS|nr:hypothetical protein WISP_106863 [Willisornis vidua]